MRFFDFSGSIDTILLTSCIYGHLVSSLFYLCTCTSYYLALLLI